MFEWSKKAFSCWVVILCLVKMSDYFSDDDNLSLAGLTQEDPKYIDVVNETSDEEESSNLSELFKCAKQLGGNDKEVTSGTCNMSHSAYSIGSTISDPNCDKVEEDITPKRMIYYEGNLDKKVCMVIRISIEL